MGANSSSPEIKENMEPGGQESERDLMPRSGLEPVRDLEPGRSLGPKRDLEPGRDLKAREGLEPGKNLEPTKSLEYGIGLESVRDFEHGEDLGPGRGQEPGRDLELGECVRDLEHESDLEHGVDMELASADPHIFNAGESMLHQNFLNEATAGDSLATRFEEFSIDPTEPSHQDVTARDCLLESIVAKEVMCVTRSNKEVALHRFKLSSLSKKNVPFHQFSQLVAERELFQYSIDESKLRMKVFLQFCLEIKAKLRETQLTAEVDLLQASFYREVSRYEKGLPIYAHRIDIMKMIEQKQVSIVIGETGSGKSTQLVQYLYEAQYSSNGLIACTQPRKLAAISLAEHVSKEVNEEVGETYGYISARSKLSVNTGVVYMTDHTLLNECISDPNLSKYSCLVIDEAHERSIHTDILIAFIKRCLPNRPDLKVIITSATINPTLFSSYFGGEYECPVVNVPGRTYPVEVHWESAPILSFDYVTEAVGKIHDIHVSRRGEPGDILVFLTCPAEIERACGLAEDALKNEAVVLPLHGKLQPEDQQRVFEATPGKRKVIFSTNVAETSITIPGIVYVIDTGLSKEMCYDPQKNMNSLEIRPISKSSADQRKGRAGRTCPGQCYRLYSKADYTKMRNDSTPEILRITLAFAVIKLYEFGIKEIHSFEFVESPDRKALDDAIENLKFLGAIRDDKLTKLGERMALLPIEPNLAKVLFDGIKKGIPSEAAAAVAVSTLAGRVYFRPAAIEMQLESDNKRLTFCQQTGDQMTHLHTYFHWSQQEKGSQNKWCVANYVNAKTMRMVKQVVDELRHILRQRRIAYIPDAITSLDLADKLLPKIFFDSFMQNICVHLGHNRVGYWSARLPDQQLMIYYGSSLYHLSSVPQCVVYETTQKTSQHFLLQALPVREEWIQEAVQSGKLSCHPAENPLYKSYQVSALPFTNLGPSLSAKFQHKFPQFRKTLVPEFSYFEMHPVFEHYKEQGALKIFAQKKHHAVIKGLVSDEIESFKKKLLDETREYGVTSDNDDVKLVIGAGGRIQRILMPGDFHTIVVRGLVIEVHISAAQKELEMYGPCTFNVNRNPKGNQLFVKFQNPSDAAKALSHEFASFSYPNVRIQNCKEQNRNNYRMEIEWCRRPRQDYAFVNFTDDNFFNVHISPHFTRYNRFSRHDAESMLTFQRQKMRSSLRVTGVLLKTTEEFIRSSLLEILPLAAETEFSIQFIFEKSFEETDESYLKRRERLYDSLTRCAPRTKYYVDFLRPMSKNVKYKAFVSFDDSSTCLQMLKHMRENEVAYTVKISLQSSVRYPAKVFSVILPSIAEISHRYAKTTTVKINYDKKDRWGNTFVGISAGDVEEFTKVKETLTKAVEPDVIQFTDCNESQYVSTANFLEISREIQLNTSTYIKVNASSLSTSSILIYGTSEQREKAREAVKTHLTHIMSNGVECFEFNLRDHSPGLMKHLIHQYGSDVAGLAKAIEGVKAARLTPRRQTLTLFATEDGYQSFLLSLTDFKPDNVTEQAKALDETEVNITSECCVCFESHNSKKRKTFFYRLEYCGHVYCKECIGQQLDPTSIVFPVTCAADGCEQPFVWKDFENLFNDKVVGLRDVTSPALRSYVGANKDKICSCITPDCDMIYVKSLKDGKRFVCGQCGANICTKCHATWHEGFDTCEGYQNRTAGDVELVQWMSKDPSNRKKCPKCSAPIEKNRGCQHMTCAQCKHHICWICLAFFEKSGDCYDHLTANHGGAFGGAQARLYELL